MRVTNPDRVLWPATRTTKAELIDYYLAVAPILLPHLRRRPVMLWRFPDGVDGPGWFQANCRGRPPWLPIAPMIGRSGKTLEYCLVEEPAALAWLANLGTIELHPFLRTVDAPAAATVLALDLDPGPPASLTEACLVALRVRSILDAFALPSVVKTSGSLGLHVYVPIAGASFQATKAFARALGRRLAAEAPALVVEASRRSERPGRVFLDWIQNDPNRQMIAAYSARAVAIPLVSTPVSWDEVAAVAESGRDGDLRFGFRDVLDRIARDGDLFAAALEPGISLPDAGLIADVPRAPPALRA
ncbi:MAG: non-homologous end-joining DNA ligase [Chloroflexota bacterium]